MACQTLSELVLCKKIEHCSVKQLKLGVEQLCEYPALLQCSWCELDNKALLQPCFMTPSRTGFFWAEGSRELCLMPCLLQGSSALVQGPLQDASQSQ